MACKYCGRPVTLTPSAEERAQKSGKTAKYYRDLFPNHTSCFLARRSADARETMRKAAARPKEYVVL